MHHNDTGEQRTVHSHSNKVEHFLAFLTKGLLETHHLHKVSPVPSQAAAAPPGRSSLLLMEQSQDWLTAGLGQDLHGLVVQGGLTHLVVHELVLAEHAQLHLRLHPHGLWDADTPQTVMTSPQGMLVSHQPWLLWERQTMG